MMRVVRNAIVSPWISLLSCCVLSLTACQDAAESATVSALFESHTQGATGIKFANTLTANSRQNIFDYMYFYNGAGVGAGDFDGDGLIDLYFAGNQVTDAVYRNSGGLQFEEVTSASGILVDSAWSTGVSVVDVNGDGLLDVYVSIVGAMSPPGASNRLYINESTPGDIRFSERARDYGLAIRGYGTQAAWLDFDRDGDLDVYLLRHSVHQRGTFGPRASFTGTTHPEAGDLLLRNDGGTFVDVTAERGVTSTALGYGLGVGAADLNGDGWIDLYVANDFHEDDYLYINHRGTFREALDSATTHTSRFSMGLDIADVNGDALPDIMVTDMLPSDPTILKASANEDTYDIQQMKVRSGYGPQYSRNSLQLNLGTRPGSDDVPLFLETALQAGVAATDWSWSVLLNDYDRDGHVDAFVSNGIRGRSNDMDYIKFVSSEHIQERMHEVGVGEDDLELAERMPIVRIPNRLYRGRGDGSFEADSTDLGVPSFSHGAVAVDLDLDGDLDLVTNDVDAPAQVLENLSVQRGRGRGLTVELADTSANGAGVGSSITLTMAGGKKFVRSVQPVRGFQSSASGPVHFGLGDAAGSVTSATVVWPDGTAERFAGLDAGGRYRLARGSGTPASTDSTVIEQDPPFETVEGSSVGLTYVHQENPFVEFNRQRLIPHMTSEEGPPLAVGDINGDGLDDVFVGGGKLQAAELFVQRVGGHFERSEQPDLDKDADPEDTACLLFDRDGDGDLDLIVGGGGSEYPTQHEAHRLRCYDNDGRGNFAIVPGGFPTEASLIASALVPVDIDSDGREDLLAFPRTETDRFGAATRGFAFVNRGGRFVDVTPERAPWMMELRGVTDALVTESKPRHIIVTRDWGPVTAHLISAEAIEPGVVIAPPGMWGCVAELDIDGDGRLDLFFGNAGLNSKLSADTTTSLRMYVADVDGNGDAEQIITRVVSANDEHVFATRDEVVSQVPSLRKRVPDYTSFSQTPFNDLFDGELLAAGDTLHVEATAHTILLGGLNGERKLLEAPYLTQASTIRTATSLNGLTLVFGNTYGVNVQVGRHDASYGWALDTTLEIAGFPAQTGVFVDGQSRHAVPLTLAGEPAVLVSRNSGGLALIRTNGPLTDFGEELPSF